MTVSFQALMSAVPTDYDLAGDEFDFAVQTTQSAIASFQTRCYGPLASAAFWGGRAASDATATAQAHIDTMTTTAEELAVVARVLHDFAADLEKYQSQMQAAVDAALTKHLLIDDSGNATPDPAYLKSSPDFFGLADLSRALEEFTKARDGILKGVTAADDGAANYLDRSASDMAAVPIDSSNTAPGFSSAPPPYLASMMLNLGVDPSDLTASDTTGDSSEALREKVARINSMLDAAHGSSDEAATLQNYAKLLQRSPDADVRELGNYLSHNPGGLPLDFVESKWFKGAGVGFIAVDGLLNWLKYSKEGGGPVEVAVKTADTTGFEVVGGTAGGAVGSEVGGLAGAGACEAIGLGPEDPLADICAGGSLLGGVLGIFGGSKAGEKAAESLNHVIFGEDGLPDPLTTRIVVGKH